MLNLAVLLVTDAVMGSLHVDGPWPAVGIAAVISVMDLAIEGISRSFRSALARST